MLADDQHRARMDAIYRHQRHFYDATRKFCLLGRDRLIRDLAPPTGGSVLEIGCGTGRNLIVAARLYPEVRFYGIDLSREMLATARANVARARLSGRILLAQADAATCDPKSLFACPAFDRVFISYALSMIPGWKEAMQQSMDQLMPGGSLHVVDFGQFERWPEFVRRPLLGWLAAFSVTPRPDIGDRLADLAHAHRATLRLERLYLDYSRHGVITR